MRPLSLIVILISSFPLMSQDMIDLGPDELTGTTDIYINKNNKILIGTSGGLYESTDFGATFQRPTSFRSDVYLHPRFTENQKHGELYMFGSTAGALLYASKDDGESWK